MDKKEFEQVFKDNYAKMFRFAMSIIADEEESRDIVHNVFARLLDGSVTLIPSTVHTYLMTSVRNACINFIRHKSARERFENLYSADVEAENEDAYMERLDSIATFIEDNLTERTRQVFTMRYLEGMKYQEIADALGISRVAVYKHLAQGLEKIKANFKK